MTGVEVFDWFAENYHKSDIMREIFGKDYNLEELSENFPSEEVIELIEAYEKKKKEPEVEWVYKCHELVNGTRFFETTIESLAIDACWSRTKKTGEGTYYIKRCRVKE